MGLNSIAIIELYGILEYYFIRHLSEEFQATFRSNEAKILFSKEGYQTPISFFASKWLLKDITNIYYKMGILTKEEVKAIEKIIAFRNSFAHKNMPKLSKLTGSATPVHVLDIDNESKTITITDPKRHILMTGKILLKISNRSRKIQSAQSIAKEK